MKNFTIVIFTSLFSIHLSSQPVIFVDQTELLRPVAGFTAFSDCIVDMNGDFLDDVVRVGEKGIFIDYQQRNGSFSQRQFNFSIQSPPSWSICAGDLDNNGYNDLLFANSSSVSFIKESDNGTRYQEFLMPGLIESQRSTMADINNDGWLDAFVCHESGESIPYRNQGNGSMIPDTNLIQTSDLVGNYAALWTDYDNDGDIDLYISKCWETAFPGDSVRTNLLYRNNNDGTFTEVAGQADMNDNAQTWSTAFEDFDNDGDFDAFILNHDFAHRLMRNNGDGTFTDVMDGSGIDSLDLIGYETSSGDFNNDGYIDLFTDLMFRMYLGNGDLTFIPQELPMIPGGIGDLNDDGFLDVFSDNKLWMNRSDSGHWIKINTIGLESNRNGIGARIEIYGDWGIQTREVRSGQAYSPMNSLTTHFGLGQFEHVDSLIVKWPSGIVSQLNDLRSDTTFNIPEAPCLLPSIRLNVNRPIMLCPSESITIPGPDGFADYQWSNGDTTRSTILSAEGVYFLIVTDSLGCVSMSQLIQVQNIEDHKPTITADDGIRFCEGDTLVLTSSRGENYRWSTGEISVQSIQVTRSGSYTVAVDAICFVGQITSDSFRITALPSPVPSAMDVYIFPGDSILLMASGENIHWYDQEAGGSLLATGPVLQTTSLNSSATYYVESHFLYASESQSGGKADTSGAGGLPDQNGHLEFESWEPFLLNSVTVYVPKGGPQGIRFIQLYTDDTLAASRSFTLTEGLNVLNLDFEVPVGKHILSSPQGNLFRNAGPLDYPYPIGDAGQITGSSNGENYYYYFYDWKITKPEIECISERIPFNVIVSSTTNQNVNPDIRIFPNPTDKMVFVDIPDYMLPANLLVTNSFGANVFKATLSERLSNLAIDQLPPGFYTLQLVHKDSLVTLKLNIQ